MGEQKRVAWGCETDGEGVLGEVAELVSLPVQPKDNSTVSVILLQHFLCVLFNCA